MQSAIWDFHLTDVSMPVLSIIHEVTARHSSICSPETCSQQWDVQSLPTVHGIRDRPDTLEYQDVWLAPLEAGRNTKRGLGRQMCINGADVSTFRFATSQTSQPMLQRPALRFSGRLLVSCVI